MPIPFFKHFDDDQCEYKPWYEPTKSWIQLARVASAVGKGGGTWTADISPGAEFGRSYSAGSEVGWLPGVVSYGGENVPEIATGSPAGPVKHAAVPYFSLGSDYAVILDAAAEPTKLGEEKDWLEMARDASSSGKVGYTDLYFKHLGAYPPLVDAVTYRTNDAWPGDRTANFAAR